MALAYGATRNRTSLRPPAAFAMTGIVVVDELKDWPLDIPDVEVVAAWDYLTQARFIRPRGVRVYNLCRSFSYQSTGYYVSLLAHARGHKPLPDIATVQDLKLAESPSVLNDELDELIEKSLARIGSGSYVLNVYFGQNPAKRHERLARELFNLFPAPLLQARFEWKADAWRVARFGAAALGEVPVGQREFMHAAARHYFGRRRAPAKRRENSRYNLAILVNEDEAEAPSNSKALKAFEKAAEELGIAVDFIDKSDYGRVAEYDALFIRETTAVNHHTYRFARRAAREGLVVMDDPESILRCANKVYQAQLMERHRIPQPKTFLIHRGNLNTVGQALGFPCVLKQPDSQFSKGVIKVDNEAAFKRECRELLERSDLIVGQSFEPTEYDWRIGVLDGVPLYACRYFMAQGHWQIVKREGGKKHEGNHETLALGQVPPLVIKTAVDAANAIGRGLYGVDLKQFGKVVKVIEVNDNPNIDFGVEDLVLKGELYKAIMQHFLKRLDALTQARQ